MHCAELTGRKETRKDGESVNVCVCVCECVCVREREREREAEETEINCGADLYSRILQPVQRHRCSPNPRVPETLGREIQPQHPAVWTGDALIVSVSLCVPRTLCISGVFLSVCVCVCAAAACVGGSVPFFYLFIYLFIFISGLKGALYRFLHVCVHLSIICIWVGRLFSSLQILKLMMQTQAQAETQRGRLTSGLRPLIILSRPDRTASLYSCSSTATSSAGELCWRI